MADIVEKEFVTQFCAKAKVMGSIPYKLKNLASEKDFFCVPTFTKAFALNNKSSFQNVIITTTANLCVVELLASSAVAVCNFA